MGMRLRIKLLDNEFYSWKPCENSPRFLKLCRRTINQFHQKDMSKELNGIILQWVALII